MTRMSEVLLCAAFTAALLVVGVPTEPESIWAAPSGAASEPSTAPPISNTEKPSSLIPSKTVDKAGERIGKGIDRFSESASRRIGGWVNAPVFVGITWLKLFFCLFLIFLVILFERMVQLTFKAKVKRLPPDDPAAPWMDQILNALSRPLTLFMWVYGIYVALSPLYAHFRTAIGTNPVHAVAAKATDIGVAIAVIWFSYRLVYVASTSGSKNGPPAPIVPSTTSWCRLSARPCGCLSSSLAASS